MVSYDDLQSWKPEQLDAAADELNTARKGLQDQQDEMDAGKKPDTWIGQAAGAAERRYQQLINSLNDIAAPLSEVINGLDEASATIKRAKDSAKNAHDTAVGKGWKVDTSTPVTITSGGTETEDGDESTMKELAQAIQDALTDAEGAETDLVAILNRAKSDGYDGGDGSIEDASLPPELRGLPYSDIVNKMLENPGKYDGYVDALPDDVQAQLGKEISDRLDSTLNDDDYKISKDELDRLNSMLTAFTDDDTVAAGLYQDLGADGTVASISRIEEYLRMNSADGDSLNSLASNIRNGLASASNHQGFPAEQFGHDLVKYAGPSGLYLSDDEQDALRDRYPNWGGTGGASVLTYLMKDHDLNGNLVLGAAEELDRFERAKDPLMTAQQWYQHTGYSPLDTGATDSGWGDDPMAAILGNLGDHPEQGYQFLTEDTARQDYYFDKRTWQADGYAGVSELAEGIGTNQGLLDSHPKETTELVSKFFHDVTDNEGFNAEDAKAASPHVAELMKFYTPGIDAALHNPDNSGEPGSEPFSLDHYGKMDPYPKFYKGDLENMMKVSMSTQEGMTSIAEGVGTFQQTQINNIAAELAQHPNDPGLRTELRDVLERGGHLQGFAEHAVGEVEIDGAKDRDAQRQAFIDLTSEVAGMIPLPGAEQVGDLGSKVIEYGVGQAIDLGTDAAGEKFANEAAAATDNANVRASEGINRVELNALFALERAGVIDIPATDETFHRNGEVIKLTDVPADDVDRYAHEAMNYLNEYVTSGDFEGTYKDAFLEYYK